MTAVRVSTWIYPWDLADEGVDTVLALLRDHGFQALDLAANYHAIATLAPHNPRRRVMYTETGAVFFPARIERYERILPQLWPETAVLRAWPAVAERLDRYGLRLNAWTIGLFQPWLARAYPDCARVLPFGDRLYAGVCPANPDVQVYLTRLCADLADQFPLTFIDLEGIGFPDFAYGWVRERIGIALSDWTRFLLSLCFCPACERRAADRGVAVERLRRWVVAEIEERFQAPGDTPPDEPAEEFIARQVARDPDFAGFLEAREAAVVGLVRAIARAVADARPGTRIVVYGRADRWPRDGLRLERVLDVVGGVILPSPAREPLAARAVRDLVRRSGQPVALIHNQWSILPERPGSPEFRAQVRAALDLGVDQVIFYHYGLLKHAQLPSLIAALRPAL